MKKYLYILLCMFFMSSCELEIPSQMSLSANSQLNDSDVEKLLNGLYLNIVNPSGYGYFNILYPDILADDFKPVKFQWYQVQYAYEHKVPSDDILNGYMYPFFYTGISRANIIIKAPSASDEQKANARYCRAISYLRLIDLYGPVPKVDENYENTPIKRSSVDEILNFVVEDLKFAKEKAKNFQAGVADANTKPTSEAAQALLARVYRLQGKINEAGKEAEDLIKSGKFSLSKDPKGDRDKEVIMNFATLPSTSTSNAEWGYILSYEARNWNCFAISDEVINLIKGDDTRKVFYDIDSAKVRDGYVYTNKYKNQNADSELMISRLSEMYLISAEAGNANRLKEFQAMRNSSLSLDDERRLEFAAEFIRLQELRHKGKTKYYVPIPKFSVDANPLLKETEEQHGGGGDTHTGGSGTGA